MKITIEIDNIKMMRETLCIAQSAVTESTVNWSKSTVDRLGKLIKELDKHRPLGSDGKHGNLHTETCGCEDSKPQRNMVTGDPIPREFCVRRND